MKFVVSAGKYVTGARAEKKETCQPINFACSPGEEYKCLPSPNYFVLSIISWSFFYRSNQVMIFIKVSKTV